MITFKNAAIALALIMLVSLSLDFQSRRAETPTSQVLHRTVKIDGLDIFYREAGPKDAPTVLLLHGFPTSSHMFRNLIPALADKYHVVAPDYPGFGNSSAPVGQGIRLHIRQPGERHRQVHREGRPDRSIRSI